MSSIVKPDPAIDDAGVHYPSSDGRPLGETDWNVDSTFALYGVLKVYLQSRTDAYVAANMFLYYERGNPRANRSPDCMVILGVDGNLRRRSFKTWVEGAVPSVIFEFASTDTYLEDLGAKRELYEELGVKEYFLFDPLGECFTPRLQGFRLIGSRYQPMTAVADDVLESEVLGLRFTPHDFMLRVVESATGRHLPDFLEAPEFTQRALELAERKGDEAEQARLSAEEERRRADEERNRADALAAELEQLRKATPRNEGTAQPSAE
jgi:Uma2 family endonuclease